MQTIDPDEILAELLDAGQMQDLDRYQELSDELYGWLGSGGRRPSAA